MSTIATRALATAALATSALLGVPAAAGASPASPDLPATSCATLHQRVVRDYDIYQEDVHKYGKNSQRTRQAYDTYEEALHQYRSQC